MPTGRLPNRRATAAVLSSLVEAELVPWAPWVPEPDVCAERIAELSVSQRHTLELLAAGYSAKQVARMRNVAHNTVLNLLGGAYRTLGVSSFPHGLIVLNRAKAVA